MTREDKQNRTSAPTCVLRSVLTAAALGAGFLALTAPATYADGAVYQQHTVNAGVLVNGTDPAPYLFYVLNNRPDVRPPDLTLVNPLAPASAQPNQAAYWEVRLNDVSDTELSRYNVLYLRADGIGFGPAVNEKLRRFVDGGGQLIVEYGQATSGVRGLFTGTGAAASSGGVNFPLTGAGAGTAQVHQPVVSQPYMLTQPDLNSLTAPAFMIVQNTGDALHSAEFNSLFSSALVNTSANPFVSTAQIGAGQVVVSSLNFGTAISGPTPAATFNSANFYNASPAETSSLKLLANMVAYSEAHPNENKTSHGNASNAGLASFSPAWQFPQTKSPTTNAPVGAAVWGNFVFVTDAAGTLHAFDAYPSESLLGSSYDEIWNVPIGALTSAPTVAAFNRTNYVFVEKADGSVVSFNAVTGAAGPTPAMPTTPTPYTAVSYTTTNAPSPTFYDGRIYAGQANGSLHVHDLNEGTAGNYFVPLNPTPPTGVGVTEAVTGPPAVGLLAGGDASVLTAVVPTQYNMYTVLLGGRNEPLKSFTSGGTLTGYSINRSGRYDVSNLVADRSSTVPPLQAYDSNSLLVDANGVSIPPSTQSPVPSNNLTPQDPLFSIINPGSYFTDWNMDFTNAVTGGGSGVNPVNLNYISAFPYGEVNATPTSGATAMSAPAIDRNGNAYYTETLGADSYVVCVGNTPLHSNVHLKFRFRLPTDADKSYWDYQDADFVNYKPLIGYAFVGAPVVDDQGNVYAAATNTTTGMATVLCFRGNQSVAAVLPLGSVVDLTSTTISQPDEGGNSEDNSIFRGPDTNVGAANAVYGQFIGSPSSLTFYNFGKRGSTFSQISGSLTEPQPVTATDTLGSGAKTQLRMRTNLAWYVSQFPIKGPVTGLSQVGSSLFLTDGVSLFRLSTKPPVSSSPGSVRVVTTLPTGVPLAMGSKNIVGAPPSVGGSVMVVNGTNGIAALTRQITVIADSGRVMGVDGDGGAVWAVDATTRTDTVTGASTKVAFSHPAALSQFAPNDYLAADTGNNRCVRFDSGGNVRWELTRFSDPYGVLGAGQPLTLSQPSSVVTHSGIVPAGQPLAGDIVTYYLVADSGNNRILEVADFYNPTKLAFDQTHVLTWTSHTGDRDGRSYRYSSAAYYSNGTSPSGYSIAAVVANMRIGTLAANGLGAASGDSAGGSIAVFNQTGVPQPFSAFNAAAPSDLAFTTAGFYAATVNASGGVTYTPFTIRNPRFLHLYTPLSSPTAANPNVAAFDFLYADDNGAFDLTFDPAQKAFVASADRLRFTTADYQNMALPAFGVGTALSRKSLPFIAASVQGLSTDNQPAANGGSAVTTRRYLITQSYGQGELGAGGKIGGEVFEVDVTNPPPAGASGTLPFGGYGVADIGGFSGQQTLSHPTFAGPLIQPTDAIRLP